MGVLETLAAASLRHVLIATVALTVISVFGVAVSRLHFHPLSRLPGPRLAAVTRFGPGSYYDVIQDGAFSQQVPALHKRFGPVVRVAPNHVHVDDPDFYREVFCAQTNYWKAPWFYNNLGINDSLFSIINPYKHCVHRATINPLFSTAATGRMAPLIDSLVGQASKITGDCLLRGEPVNLQTLFRSITVDVIYTACFGSSQHLTAQYEHDVIPELIVSLNAFTARTNLTKHFPILLKVALALPGYARVRTVSVSPALPPVTLTDSMVKQLGECVGEVKSRRKKGICQTKDGNDTVFDLFMEPNANKGYKEPTKSRLVDEAILIVIAGSDSTAYAMTSATYGLLTNRECEQLLKEELRKVPRTANGMFAWREISELPYLTAVVKESLRMSSSVPGILPRVVPPGGVTVQGKFILADVMVSASIFMIHNNPNLFPSPEKFRPDRWLGQEGKDLDKWMVAFLKGPKACIGLK